MSIALRPPCSFTYFLLATRCEPREYQNPACSSPLRGGGARPVRAPWIDRGVLLTVFPPRGESVTAVGRSTWTPFGPQRKEFRALPTQVRSVTGGKEVIWALVVDPRMVRTSHETSCVLHQPKINVPRAARRTAAVRTYLALPVARKSFKAGFCENDQGKEHVPPSTTSFVFEVLMRSPGWTHSSTKSNSSNKPSVHGTSLLRPPEEARSGL